MCNACCGGGYLCAASERKVGEAGKGLQYSHALVPDSRAAQQGQVLQPH